MRILAILAMFLLSGCLKHAIREPAPDDTIYDGKSDIRQLEDRLGV